MEKTERSVADWGVGNPMAPSRRKTQPSSWLMTSAVGGALVFTGAMALMWRELPMLPVPQGDFGTHAAFALKSAWHLLWPAAYEREAATYAAHIKSFTQAHGVGPLASRLVLAGLLSLVPSVATWGSFMTPRDGLMHVRGPKRFTGREAAKRLKKKLAPDVKLYPDQELAPGIVYPSSLWTRHVLVVGGVGSGKSTFIRPLISSVIHADEKALIFDPKGEFTSAHGKPILIAPWDARSYAWDIGADIRNIGDMRRFAHALIKEGHDPMWANAARQILVGFMRYLQSAYGSLWGWKELREMFFTPEEDLLALMDRFNPEARRTVEKPSVTTTGILINLTAFGATIFDLATAWADVPVNRRVSFVRWVQDPSYQKQVILQGHGAYPDMTKAFTEGIFGVVSALVNSVEVEDSTTAKFWIIADEFPQLGNVPVRALFEVGRSRGVRCVIACQDLAQVEAIYGKEQVKSLTAMCGTLIIGQVGAGETAEILSKAIGSREVERENVSASFNAQGATGGKSTTITYNRDELALYKPSELTSRLGPQITPGGVVMCVSTGGNAYELYWPFVSPPKERKASIPAAWTLGTASKSEPGSKGPDAATSKTPTSPSGPKPPATKAVPGGEEANTPHVPDDLGQALLEELGVVPRVPEEEGRDEELDALFEAAQHQILMPADPLLTAVEKATKVAETLERKPGPAPTIGVQPKSTTSPRASR